MAEVNLYKVRSGWAVVSQEDWETYPTIELAADVLMSMGVKDDQIDVALIEMYGNAHSRANFGVNGTLIMTDEAKLDVAYGST